MNIKLDIFETMSIATFVFYLGQFLRKKIKFLSKYCIPAPVIGGLYNSSAIIYDSILYYSRLYR